MTFIDEQDFLHGLKTGLLLKFKVVQEYDTRTLQERLRYPFKHKIYYYFYINNNFFFC